MSLFRKKNIRDMIAKSQQTELKKILSATDLVFLGIGAIIGTGIFVLTATGAVLAGPALTLSFVIAAIACGLAALSYAEFSSSIPVTGSIYTYSYATLGEVIAWIIGWDLMLEYGLAASAVAVGWSAYFQSLLSGFGIHIPEVLSAAAGSIPNKTTYFNLPAFLIMMLITALLSIGIKESKRINNFMVIIKLSVIILVIVVGVFHIKPANWHPFMPNGLSGVFSASAIMFFAFIGFDAVSSAAEEVKNPRRDLPIGIIGSLAICTILYLAVTATVTGIVPTEHFKGITNSISFALKSVGENWAAGFIDLGAVAGMLTVILVMSYAQIRIIFAMSRDGLLPKKLSSIHTKYKTPFFTTWSVGLFFGFFSAVVPLNILAELINMGTLAAFSMVSIAVIVLRKTHPELPRSFKCPGVPFVPICAILACVFLMLNLQLFTWIAFFIWLLIGLIIYFLYSRKHAILVKKTD